MSVQRGDASFGAALTAGTEPTRGSGWTFKSRLTMQGAHGDPAIADGISFRSISLINGYGWRRAWGSRFGFDLGQVLAYGQPLGENLHAGALMTGVAGGLTFRLWGDEDVKDGFVLVMKKLDLVLGTQGGWFVQSRGQALDWFPVFEAEIGVRFSIGSDLFGGRH